MVRDTLKIGDVVLVKSPTSITRRLKGKYGTVVNIFDDYPRPYPVLVAVEGEECRDLFDFADLELVSAPDDELYY